MQTVLSLSKYILKILTFNFNYSSCPITGELLLEKTLGLLMLSLGPTSTHWHHFFRTLHENASLFAVSLCALPPPPCVIVHPPPSLFLPKKSTAKSDRPQLLSNKRHIHSPLQAANRLIPRLEVPTTQYCNRRYGYWNRDFFKTTVKRQTGNLPYA